VEFRLRVLIGKNAGYELPIPAPKFLIGRAEDCQLRPASELISRHHCLLLIEESSVVLRDFGSKNGTQVNGERVEGERPLKVGDKLKIGPLEFELCVKASIAASKKKPKVESVKEAAARTAGTETKELDVFQWLSEGDEKRANTETRTFAMQETTRIDSPVSPAAPTADSPTVGPTDSPVAPKGTPGKLPPVPQANHRDSRAAAADVLNKLLKQQKR
jgi:pSer/pThr/pTyr-binding forkhead associated (FHA) protein